MPRRYTKKSDYWDRFATNDETKGNLEDLLRETRSLDGEEVTPASM